MNRSPIDACSNLFGRMQAPERARLKAVLANPSIKTWDNAYSLIINGDTRKTLWQAWIAVDPTAPRCGKVTDQRGRVLEDWQAFPDRATLERAIVWATR